MSDIRATLYLTGTDGQEVPAVMSLKLACRLFPNSNLIRDAVKALKHIASKGDCGNG